MQAPGRILLPLSLTAVVVLAACTGARPAYRPGAPGQWAGEDARAGYPWRPPAPAPAPRPSPWWPQAQPAPGQTAPFPQPAQLIGTAVGAINVLLGQPSAGPWPAPSPAPLPHPQPDPRPAPDPAGFPAAWAALEEDVLARTNERRALGAVCGGRAMPPAPPVAAHAALRSGARGHSRDMAQRDFFSHTTPEGAGPGERATRAGFSGSFVGENIAAGQTDPARVMQAWLDSPGHCENLMDPSYKVLGVGYFHDAGPDPYGHYWTQNFGG